MPTYEHNTLMQYKDQNGDMHLTYPVTKAENVDGLYGDAALTGVPTAPTASSGTNTTQIATTAFVHQELEEVKATIPEEPDLTAYAPLESPALTGTPIAPTAAFGTNTSQVATTAFVQRELTEVKKSVSDGKKSVANAITAKGVETATDATFDIMAANIALIESGDESSALSLNVFTQETEPETKDGVWIQTTNSHQSVSITTTEIVESSESETIEWEPNINLPYDFKNGSAVVYNNEIHILGGENDKVNTGIYHYKFDGAKWSKVSTLPYKFCSGSAVVYNNEIHILGSSASSILYKYHYKFDGTTWSKASTLPYDFHSGIAVVYNNEIHILSSSANSRLYKDHYKFDGAKWSRASTLPYAFYYGSAVVYNNEIHILGGGNTSTRKYHYKFDGTTWSKVSTLPYDFYRCSPVVYNNNEIHILGGGTTKVNTGTYHYKFDGTTWSEVSTLPYDFKNGSVVIYNGKIHILGGSNSLIKVCTYTLSSIDNVNASKIVIYQNPSNNTGIYATNFISGVPITGENNKFPSGFDNVYYIDDFGNMEKSPIYYGDGTQWIKLKN